MNGAAPTRSDDPYVGPVSFRAGDLLYGRDREREELLDLLIAERIVLLYSPSGAGKTSLIEAALVPALVNADFEVLPTIRVTHALPPEPGLPVPRNRYVMGVLLSLEERVPPERQLPMDELAAITLQEYLEAHVDRDGRPGNEVLVFDQFEEVLTADPTDDAAKHAFFQELGHALRNPELWALFSMREDFLAALDPYLKYVPTRLRSTFRLDLLSVPAALEAIRRPAQRAGVHFTEEAAEQLVDDLRVVRVQRAGGVADVLGSFVEPVQLQVACHLLWSMLPEDATKITRADVDALGRVDHALGEYYAERVQAIAVQSGVPERLIRDWFEERLITPQGLRSQVLEGPSSDNGHAVLAELLDAHLVRAETRRQATWYELAHDRLIDPVRHDNAAWRTEHLSPLERAAMHWEQEGKPDRLLLLGAELAAAESGVAVTSGSLSTLQREFLDVSRKADAQANRERETAATLRRSARRLRIAVIVMAALAVTSVIGLVTSVIATNEAADQEEASTVFLGAQENLGSDDPLAVALASEGARADDGPLADHARRVLYQAAQSPVELVLHGQVGPSRNAALSGDWSIVVTAGSEDLRRWNRETGAPLERLGLLEGEVVNSLDTNDDATTVVAGLNDGTVIVWDVDAGVAERWETPGGMIWWLDLSPDGTRIATTTGSDRFVRIWRLDGELERELTVPGSYYAYSARFSSDGTRLAVSSDRSEVTLWDVDAGRWAERVPLPAGEVALAIWFREGEADTLATWTWTYDTAAAVWAPAALTVWDVTSGSAIHEPHPLYQDGYSYNLSRDLSRAIEADPSGRLTAYDLASDTVVATAEAWGAAVTSAAFDLDPQRAFVLSSDAEPAFWLLEPRYGTGYASATAATVAGDDVLIAWDDVRIRRWSEAGGSAEGVVGSTLPQDADPDTGAFASDDSAAGPIAYYKLGGDSTGSRVVALADVNEAGAGRGEVRVWDAHTGDELAALRDDSFTAAALTPDGDEMVVAHVSGDVSLRDVAIGAVSKDHVFSTGGRVVTDIEISSDGSKALLVLGPTQGQVFEDVDGGEPEDRLPAAVIVHLDDDRAVVELFVADEADQEETVPGSTPTAPATSGAFTRDGRRVILGTSDGRVMSFDAESGDPESTVNAHQGEVAAIIVGDAERLVMATGGPSAVSSTMSGITQAVLVDIDRGEVVRTVLSEDGLITAMLADNGREMVLFTVDGAVHTVPIHDDDLVDLVDGKVTHQLTEAECEYYRIERTC